jgi:hypothetical protein
MAGAMSDQEEIVHCGDHGTTAATFMCHHLVRGVGCGFHTADEPDDPWPDAWCALCESTLNREEGWTEAAAKEADVRLSCARCYEKSRSANLKVPAPLRPDELHVEGERLEQLLEAACAFAKKRQQEAARDFRLGSYENFFIDRVAGEITFSGEKRPSAALGDMKSMGLLSDNTKIFRQDREDENNVEEEPVMLGADIIPVGSFSINTKTWLWHWENNDATDEERRSIIAILMFGRVRGIERLTNPHWAAEEADGWDMANLAAYLLDGEAIYRAPHGHLFMFMVLKNLRYRRNGPSA